MVKKLLALLFLLMVVASAVYALRDRRNVTTNSNKALKAYNEAESFRGKLYYREAIEQYRAAVGYDSSFAMAYARLASLTQTFLNQMEEARSLSKKASALSEKVKDREKLLIAIIESDIGGDTTKSRRLKEELLAEYPDLLDAHLYQAERYQKNQEWDNAIKEYNQVLKLDPNFALAYNMLAYLHYFKRDYDQAVEYVRKYAEIAEGQANPHDSYGEILMNIGKYDEAIAQFKAANKIKPDLFFVLMHLGDAHKSIGRIRDAVGYYQRARDYASGQFQKRECDRAVAGAYWTNGLFSKAASLLEALAENNPASVIILLDLGALYVTSGEIGKAEMTYKRVRELIDQGKAQLIGNDPALEYKEYGIGLVWLEAMIDCAKGDYDSAIVKYQQTVEQTSLPRKIWVRYFLGQCYHKKGDLVRARDTYLLNFADNPNHAQTLLALADVHESLRQPEQQKEALLRYLSVMSGADDDIPDLVRARRKLDKLIGA